MHSLTTKQKRVQAGGPCHQSMCVTMYFYVDFPLFPDAPDSSHPSTNADQASSIPDHIYVTQKSTNHQSIFPVSKVEPIECSVKSSESSVFLNARAEYIRTNPNTNRSKQRNPEAEKKKVSVNIAGNVILWKCGFE